MEKHTAVVFARKMRKEYRSTWHGMYGPHYFDEPHAIDEHIGDIKVGEYELNKPHLNVGDGIYLHELEESTVVRRIERSTDNKYMYYTDHVLEAIEDKKSEESYQRALNEIQRNKEREEHYSMRGELPHKKKRSFLSFWED